METLAVPIDRGAVDRSFGLMVGLLALPVLMAAAFAAFFVSQGAASALLIFAIPVVVTAPLAIALCVTWNATRRLAHPLELTAYGMMFDTPRGRVSFPWDAVAGLAITQGLLTKQLDVKLHPQAGPGGPGIVSTLSPSAWRYVRRSGLRLSLRVVQTAPADLARAIAHFSAGRWTPRPVAGPREDAARNCACAEPGPTEHR